jgi:glycerol-3-phosphate dehydrogenase
VLTVLGEAERFGAICANRVEAMELADEGVAARDLETGTELNVMADNVVNATGVWADRMRPEELHSEAEVPVVRPSRGTHITIATSDLPLVAGAVVPAAGGRFIFALPWLGRSLIGTTDNDYDGDIDHVQPALEDVDYLLEATNAFFGVSLSRNQVTGAYAGVRPLISTGDSRKSVDISRKAELYETSSGLITITGGKLTTWRRMAKLAVDRLVQRDGRSAPCRTQDIPLGEPVDPAALPRVEGVLDEGYESLARRYGHAASEVLEIASGRPELARSILDEFPDLLAEVVFAARCEQALTLADALLRRTRLGLLAPRALCAAQSEALLRVARAMGEELGWDESRIRLEVARLQTDVEAEGLVVTP